MTPHFCESLIGKSYSGICRLAGSYLSSQWIKGGRSSRWRGRVAKDASIDRLTTTRDAFGYALSLRWSYLPAPEITLYYLSSGFEQRLSSDQQDPSQGHPNEDDKSIHNEGKIGDLVITIFFSSPRNPRSNAPEQPESATAAALAFRFPPLSRHDYSQEYLNHKEKYLGYIDTVQSSDIVHVRSWRCGIAVLKSYGLVLDRRVSSNISENVWSFLTCTVLTVVVVHSALIKFTFSLFEVKALQDYFVKDIINEISRILQEIMLFPNTKDRLWSLTLGLRPIGLHCFDGDH
ncbi:hypothetical protein J6590_043049 [Homalodisca vitripennis]|nr:hypothetical protein J6590_043049 [Homalodisca vitripennis]